MFSLIAKVFRHGHASIGGNPLQSGGARRSGNENDTAFKCAFGLQRINGAAHAGCFLPYGDIYANHIACVLGNHGIDCQCCFAGRMIANDQFALPPAKRK